MLCLKKEYGNFPNFINGTFGQRPLQPPFGVLTAEDENKIEPTPLEKANFAQGFAPGALYTKTCPCKTAKDIKVFEIAAVQSKVIYNRYGWHDPQGRFFVLNEELEKYGTLERYLKEVECGNVRPEPLVIRANAGDWIEVTLYNMIDSNRPIEYFDYPSVPLDYLHKPSDKVSLNPQFLKYDQIQSSGINAGYNETEQTAGPGEKNTLFVACG